MRLICQKCSAVYTIGDDLVEGRDFRVSCKDCGTPIVVRAAHQIPSDAPPRALMDSVPVPRMASSALSVPRPPSFAATGQERWFVFLGGRQDGPYSAAQIAQLIEQSRIDWATQVWRDGMKDWRPARRDALLVTAVAGARGFAGDTMRLNAARSFLAPEDTIVELRPELLQRPSPRVVSESSQVDLLSSASDAQALDNEVTQVAEMSLPNLTPSARPQAWDSPQNAAFRAGLGLPPDSAQVVSSVPPNVPVPPPVAASPAPAAPSNAPPLGTLADAFRSVPTLMRSAPINEATVEMPLGETQESWVPKPQSMLAVAAVAFAAGVLAAALWGRFVGKPAEVVTPISAAPPKVAAEIPKPQVRQVLEQPAPVLRELPDPNELRGEVRRVAPDVKRCVEDPATGVDVDIFLDGPSGRVRDVDVRSPQLTPGRVECVAHAVRQMQLPPFSRPELKLMHKFSW